MTRNPLVCFLRTQWYLLNARLRFPRDHVGLSVAVGRGRDRKEFRIFREVVVKPGGTRPHCPGATLVVRFRVAGMTVRQNMLSSWLPIPFFVGFPGFRSKLWMVDPTGLCQGVYEWDTVEEAGSYARSFAMRFMTVRSVPGTISHWIEPTSREAVVSGLLPRRLSNGGLPRPMQSL